MDSNTDNSSKAVKIRNLTVGEGIPKLCVPVTANAYDDIIESIVNICGEYEDIVDLIEFRADYYEDIADIEKTKKLLKDIRKSAGEMPILFTFRTSDEGGEKEISEREYENLIREIVETKAADAVDVEIMRGTEIFAKIVESAHKSGVRVIASNHDFYKTPDVESMVGVLKKMQDNGADIAKIAVMPNNVSDVLKLLEASHIADEGLAIPIVTISMGKTGAISRLAGEGFGSAITFGVADKASAPGQMAAGQLKAALQMLH